MTVPPAPARASVRREEPPGEQRTRGGGPKLEVIAEHEGRPDQSRTDLVRRFTDLIVAGLRGSR